IKDVRVFPRKRIISTVRKNLTRITWPRGRANHDDQRIISRVRGWHHVFHSLLSQNLGLVQHNNVNFSEPTTKSVLTSTKQYAGPINKLNLLLTVCFTNRADKWGNLLTVRSA